MSGKPLSANPPYGYKKSEHDKNLWVIDEEAAEVVRRIFMLCIEGYGPLKIANFLTLQEILTPSAHAQKNGRRFSKPLKHSTRWDKNTVTKILEMHEYLGHTVNFKTHKKSYKCKKKINNPKEEWVIFENTHEAIISQHDFDLVQELRKNKCHPQKAMKSIHFREWFTVQTVEANCILTEVKASLILRSI